MITVKSHFFRVLLLLICANLMSSALAGGDSSDGHTHDTPVAAAPAPGHTAAPRMSSQTDQFELVGVLEGQVLTMYLDQYGTNTPVSKAQIEVASGSWKAVATEIAPAVYALTAEALTQTGRHPLTLTVLAGDETDLMDATLVVGAATPAPGTKPLSPDTGNWRIWAGMAVLALAALGLLLVRSRKHQHKHGQHSTRN